MWFAGGMLGLAAFAVATMPAEYRMINGHLRTVLISLFVGMLVYCAGYTVAVAAGWWFPGRL